MIQFSYYSETPVQKLKETLNNNSFYIKRDDLLPISFGGNKVRKAVLFFEDLVHKKCDCVVTYGSSSSNHCRVVANIASSMKIPCHIISPIESSKPTSNSKIIELLDASVIKCPVSDVSITIEQKLNELREIGYKPYFIQGGGHGNIGTKAYIRAYEEILNYERTSGKYFDYIFLTTGTGTTQAGLICGKILNNDDRKIIGISNARKNPYGREVVTDCVSSFLEELGITTTSDEIIFIDDYVLNGYGDYNEQILKTIKKVFINDGIPLDKTYTGKAFWGMNEYIKKNGIFEKNVLFIHTGGTPLFFDGLEELKI